MRQELRYSNSNYVIDYNHRNCGYYNHYHKNYNDYNHHNHNCNDDYNFDCCNYDWYSDLFAILTLLLMTIIVIMINDQ